MVIVRPGPVNVPAADYRRLRAVVDAERLDWQKVQARLARAAEDAATRAVQAMMQTLLDGQPGPADEG